MDTVLAQDPLAQETNNFLLPNATIFVELALFLIILFVFSRWIVPPLTRALQDRQDMVRKQIEDSEESVRKLRLAQERYESALAQARGEAAKIRDDARAEAQRIREELREQADREVERIRRRGDEQLAEQRAETVRQLRAEIGGLSTQLAERIVGEPPADDGRRRSTVDRFIADLEPTPTAGGTS
ncbi:MAG: F0F1 ATP synthase subunit B [Pseudonocardia sp.]